MIFGWFGVVEEEDPKLKSDKQEFMVSYENSKLRFNTIGTTSSLPNRTKQSD